LFSSKESTGRNVMVMCYCDRKARTASAQSFTIEITRRGHSIAACSRHMHMGVILRAPPVRGESHIQRNANREVATVPEL